MKRKNVFLLLGTAFLLCACSKAEPKNMPDDPGESWDALNNIPTTAHYKTANLGVALGPNGGLIYRYTQNPANVRNDEDDDTPPIQPYAPPRRK